ncbi:MAG: hypothetical protein ACW99A_01260 [Candidatus Kariarchaeaceae archaeon]|jgi:uncharacterized protein YndB with AHSA1/START domain
MSFQSNPDVIKWKIHLNSSPVDVFQLISTDEGRNKFWAKTTESGDTIMFLFPNSFKWEGKILEKRNPERFSLIYIDNSRVAFTLHPDGKNGTDLTLEDQGVNPQHRAEVIAGWGSVLMTLKAAIDFNVDLRNHDHSRTWDQGYFDN